MGRQHCCIADLLHHFAEHVHRLSYLIGLLSWLCSRVPPPTCGGGGSSGSREEAEGSGTASVRDEAGRLSGVGVGVGRSEEAAGEEDLLVLLPLAAVLQRVCLMDEGLYRHVLGYI